MDASRSAYPIHRDLDVDASRGTMSLADAQPAFEALRASTARSLLQRIYDDPATASELADRTETSIQNAQYHLDNLREADLIEVVGTWYSTKGREMDVYAPKHDPLVIVVGDDDERQALSAIETPDATLRSN